MVKIWTWLAHRDFLPLRIRVWCFSRSLRGRITKVLCGPPVPWNDEPIRQLADAFDHAWKVQHDRAINAAIQTGRPVFADSDGELRFADGDRETYVLHGTDGNQ